ncbi:MAG: ATP-binding cassette domain-containing protein [Acidobacteria bacterium]|nr:ATP-binding cassette domain-containing protein [Acidobacteriota bacterium]
MSDLLTLERVTAGYGATVILDEVSLSLGRGAALAVLGRNGVGKTTLMRTIAGQTDLHGGRVTIGDRDAGRMPAWMRARLGVGYVPQEREIFPSLTVLEHLDVGARAGAWTTEALFELFPALANRRRHFGTQLSGGEQQMLAVARALALQPALLLLDEPFEGLAPAVVHTLVDVFGAVRRTGVSIVLAEQHARLALGMTDEAIALVRGRVVLRAPSRELLERPAPLEEVLAVQQRVQSSDSRG